MCFSNFCKAWYLSKIPSSIHHQAQLLFQFFHSNFAVFVESYPNFCSFFAAYFAYLHRAKVECCVQGLMQVKQESKPWYQTSKESVKIFRELCLSQTEVCPNVCANVLPNAGFVTVL